MLEALTLQIMLLVSVQTSLWLPGARSSERDLSLGKPRRQSQQLGLGIRVVWELGMRCTPGKGGRLSDLRTAIADQDLTPAQCKCLLGVAAVAMTNMSKNNKDPVCCNSAS